MAAVCLHFIATVSIVPKWEGHVPLILRLLGFSQDYRAVSLQAMGKEVDAARPWILRLEAQNPPSNPTVQLLLFSEHSLVHVSLGLSSHRLLLIPRISSILASPVGIYSGTLDL